MPNLIRTMTAPGARVRMGGGWRIELLGRARLGWSDGDGIRLQAEKTALLLAYLVSQPERLARRETLIELLWPEEDPELGQNRLRLTLHRLRRQLAVPGAPSQELVIADRRSIGLDPAAYSSDVGDFQAALNSARQTDDPTERRRHLSAAVAHYQGELLPGSSEPWVLMQRGHLEARYLDALLQLAAALEETGELEAALETARRAVTVDPLREEPHYDVMRLAAALGQPSTALRQFQELERVFREELDETPSAEARALAEELRRSARTLVVARRAAAIGADRTSPEPPTAATSPASPPPSVPESLAPSAAPSPPEPAPPARAGRSAAAHLPGQLTRFFGREQESAQLIELLTSRVGGPADGTGEWRPVPGRLVTMTGPGGSGKTRLAIAVAGRLQNLFGSVLTAGEAAPSGGVAFVSLADVTDAGRLAEAIAASLGLERLPSRDPWEQLTAHLRSGPWLLVLDNFEQLVETAALQIRALLEEVESLTCLVTSRRPLGIAGEQEFALLPLPTPRRAATLEQLQACPSVQLFVDRARGRSTFELTAANAGAVAELCDRLEGLPLALELAAARAAVLTPEEMLAQLSQRFRFLVSRQRDLPARHQSLHAALDTSVQALSPELQRLLARLSVFRGGWTLEAAAAVVDFGFRVPSGRLDFGLPATSGAAQSRPSLPPAVGAPADRTSWSAPIQNPKSKIQNTLDSLEQLREYSLILSEPSGGETRYRMLETLREYEWAQLVASGELAAVRQRHHDWCLQLALRVEAAAYEREQAKWGARLEEEIDNVRAAMAWCQEQAEADPAPPAAHEGAGGCSAPVDGAAAVLRLVAATWWLWYLRGHVAEGLRWLEGALARGSHLPPAARALALSQAGHLHAAQGDRDRARAFTEASYCEYETLLAISRCEGDPAAVAAVALALSEAALNLDDLDATEQYGAEARQIFAGLQEAVGLASALHWLASAALRRRDARSARALLAERLEICRKLDNPGLLIHALGATGHLERDEGNYARAGALYRESLLRRRELGDLFALAQALEDLAGLASREQQHERAIRLLGAQEAFCETLGARPPVAVLEEYERAVVQGRDALGEAGFAATWAEGRAMSLEEAVEYALSAE